MCGSVFGIQIRIKEAPEYESNTDPDPQHYFLLAYTLLPVQFHHQMHSLFCQQLFAIHLCTSLILTDALYLLSSALGHFVLYYQ